MRKDLGNSISTDNRRQQAVCWTLWVALPFYKILFSHRGPSLRAEEKARVTSV